MADEGIGAYIQATELEALKGMNREEAESWAEGLMYATAQRIFENLEHAGRLDGSGHHLAQRFATSARDIVRERWRDG